MVGILLFTLLVVVFFAVPLARFVFATLVRLTLADWAILLVTAAIALPAVPVVFVALGWRLERIG